MQQINLSVIVPVFNGAGKLLDLLRSLVRQDVQALEIIVIDDGSTDDSATILDSIAQTDDRVVVLRQPNAGSSAARNAGLSIARGEWIAFADCDDWLSPATLSTWLSRASESKADVLIGNGFTYADKPHVNDRKPIFRHQPWDETISGWEWIRRATTAREWPHYVWLQLIRRDFVGRHQLRFEEGILHQDIVWTVKLALTNATFTFMREPLYGYQQNPLSVTNDQSSDALLKRTRSYVRVMELIVESSDLPDIPVSVRRALLHQVNRESRHFFGLLRHSKNQDVRSRFAQRFLSLGLHRAMLSGSRQPHELWHALRCIFALHRYVAFVR